METYVETMSWVGSAKHLSEVKGKKQAPTTRAFYCFTVKDREDLVEAMKWVITEKFKQMEKIWGIGRESERENRER